MYEYNAVVRRVIDGDTYDMLVDLGFGTYKLIRVRLRGFDTPEIYRPSCGAELKHGRAAKAYVEGTMLNRTVYIRTHKDRVGIYGRWGADVWVNGEKLVDLLEAEGYRKRENYE